MTTKQRLPTTDFMKKAYLAYLEVKLGDQDKKGLPTKFVVHVWQLFANDHRDKNVVRNLESQWSGASQKTIMLIAAFVWLTPKALTPNLYI